MFSLSRAELCWAAAAGGLPVFRVFSHKRALPVPAGNLLPVPNPQLAKMKIDIRMCLYSYCNPIFIVLLLKLLLG